MTERQWTPEIEAELIRLRNVEKRTWDFIGAQIGWSKSAAQSHYELIVSPADRVKLAARRMWTDEQSAELTRLRAEKKSCHEIADMLQLTVGQVTSRLERMARPPKRVHFARATIKFDVPQHCLEDRARRQEAERDLTAMFFGDPEPERSALYLKQQGISAPVHIYHRAAQLRQNQPTLPTSPLVIA